MIFDLLTMILVQHPTADGPAKTGPKRVTVITNGMFGLVRYLPKILKHIAKFHAIIVVSILSICKTSCSRLYTTSLYTFPYLK